MLSCEITTAPQGVTGEAQDPRRRAPPRPLPVSWACGPAGRRHAPGPLGGREPSLQLCPRVGGADGRARGGGSPAQGEQGLSVTSSQLGALQEGCP